MSSIFDWMRVGKGIGADGEIEWYLGPIATPHSDRMRLSGSEMRELYDVLGVELTTCYGDDSETARLQTEKVEALQEQARLRGVIGATRKALEGDGDMAPSTTCPHCKELIVEIGSVCGCGTTRLTP